MVHSTQAFANFEFNTKPGSGQSTGQRLHLRKGRVNLPFREKQQLVQHLVEAGGGLVNGSQNGPAPLGQLAKGGHQMHGCGAVQPCTTGAISNPIPHRL